MEVLELKPIKDKNCKINIIEKTECKLSKQETKELDNFLKNHKINVITIDSSKIEQLSLRKTPMGKYFEKYKIPFIGVNIPEFAMGYLEMEIAEKKEQIEELEKEFISINNKDSFKAQNLESWIFLLKKELIQKLNILEFKVKPQWFVKQILDIIKNCKESSISILHFSAHKHISELEKLFRELQIKTITNKLASMESNKSLDHENKFIKSAQIIN